MSLNINARTAALVLIDLQNGILSMQLAPHDAAQVVDKAVKLGRGFREIEAPLVLTLVAFFNNYHHKLNQSFDFPMQVPPGGLPPYWLQFAGKIQLMRADVVIS